MTHSSSERGEPCEKQVAPSPSISTRTVGSNVAEEREVLLAMLRQHPPLAVRRRLDLTVVQLQERALGVAAHEPGRDRERPNERERLLRERAPREVTAEDDEVGRLPLDLLEHRGERRRVAVDVRERRDAHQPRSPVHVAAADAKRPPSGSCAVESALAEFDLALNRSYDRRPRAGSRRA